MRLAVGEYQTVGTSDDNTRCPRYQRVLWPRKFEAQGCRTTGVPGIKTGVLQWYRLEFFISHQDPLVLQTRRGGHDASGCPALSAQEESRAVT